jgi:hypothetical protein
MNTDIGSIVESVRDQHPELLKLVKCGTGDSAVDFKRVICVGFAVPDSMKELIEEMANYDLLWRPTIRLPEDYTDKHYPFNYYQWVTQDTENP